MGEPVTPRRKPRKAPLSVQYVVRAKEEVDDLKHRFEDFLKVCNIFDRATKGDIPVILSQDPETKTLAVNLDPSCEIAFHDLTTVVGVVYNIGETKFVFKGGTSVKIRIGIMGPEDGD